MSFNLVGIDAAAVALMLKAGYSQAAQGHTLYSVKMHRNHPCLYMCSILNKFQNFKIKFHCQEGLGDFARVCTPHRGYRASNQNH